MNGIFYRPARRRDSTFLSRENGTAMIELGISVSLFVIILFGIVRLSVAFATKQHLEQSAQAGLDTMNRIADLEEGTFTNVLTGSGSCGALGSPASTKCPGMLFVSQRVRNLIEKVVGIGSTTGSYHIPLSAVNIIVGYQAITTLPPAFPGALEDRVWVRVQGFQPGAINLASTIWAEKSGPYLYQGLGTGFTGTPVIKNPFGIWDLDTLEMIRDPGAYDVGLPMHALPTNRRLTPAFSIPAVKARR